MSPKLSALCAQIAKKIEERSAEENLPVCHAWARVAAELLGYKEEDVEFFDNNDGGCDFYWAGDNVYQVFQCKMHELAESGDVDIDGSFGPEGIDDLARACEFLLEGGATSPNIDPRVPRLKASIASDLSLMPEDAAGAGRERAVSVVFNLVILGNRLTPTAVAAATNFRKRLQRLNKGCSGLHAHLELIDLEQLGTEYYSPDSLARASVEPIPLSVAIKQLKLKEPSEAEIRTNDFVTFYCAAVDLVQAAQKSGAALFDANVRYELKKSQVNEEIKRSASHPRTARIFHLYNNGVTIAAEGWSYKKNGCVVEIREPSVINGCQTVRSLMSARKELEDAKEEDAYALEAFDQTCSVLVRLIRKGGVSIEEVVRAANTQNAMEPRNLLGNRSEQRQIERDIQTWGWFYERKDGALDALKEMKRSSLGTPINQFKPKGGRVRACDNRDVARAWLSFIGRSDDGKNRSNRHFLDKSDEGLYRDIFLRTPKQHHDVAMLDGLEADGGLEGRPPAAWMLLGQHLLEIVKRTLPQASKLRAEARRKLTEKGIQPTIKAVNEAMLNDDRVRLQFALSMLDHVVLGLTGFVYARALREQFLAAGPVKRALNIGIVGEYHSTGRVPDSLTQGGVLELSSDELQADPALLAIRLAVRGVEATLAKPEYSDSFKSSERKSRYLQSEALLKQYCRSVDGYNKYFDSPGHFEEWWQGGSVYKAIGKTLS
jgi:hypothetical protein